MTIHRRTVVLGLPTLAGMLLAGCEGEDASAEAQSRGRMERASAQSVTAGSLKISILNGVIPTGGIFPTNSVLLAPNENRIQACINGQELNITISDVASGCARALTLKLFRAGGWDTVTQIIDMAGNSGSEGYIFHHPDQTTTPTGNWYGYKMSSGKIQISTSASTVQLTFSADVSQLVKAYPAGSGLPNRANGAAGYVYIPVVNNSVTLRLSTETEASA